MRKLFLTLILLPLAVSQAGGAESALPSSTADHDVNEIRTTITDVGAYGYFDPQSAFGFGQGFHFVGFPNALFHGGLLLGTSETTVSDATYGSDNNGATTPFNFQSTEAITVASSPAISQYTCAKYADSDADGVPLGVEVEQATYAWSGDSYVIIDVVINASSPLTGLYVALYTDWDVGANPNATNEVMYDAARQLGIMRSVAMDDLNFYGIQLLSHAASGFRAVANPAFVYPQPPPPAPPVDPGFEDADKYDFFTGFEVTVGEAGDWSDMISAGPFNLPAGGSVRVAFAMLAGINLADLNAQADGAQGRWDEQKPAGIVSPCGVVAVEPTTWGKIKASYR